MKLASGVVLAVVVALFVFWWGWVRAPNPDEVCEHIVAVTKGEAEDRSMELDSEAALVAQMKERCVAHKLDKLELRGRLVWAKYAKCVTSSTTLADIGQC